MNFSELKRLAVYKCGSVGKFSELIKWDRNKTSKLLNGKYIPSIDETNMIRISLRLTVSEYLSIFLGITSPNGDENQKDSA